MNDKWSALFAAKSGYDQAFAIRPDGLLTVEQRRTNALVRDAMSAVEAEARAPLQSRLEAYETVVNALIEERRAAEGVIQIEATDGGFMSPEWTQAQAAHDFLYACTQDALARLRELSESREA